MKDYLKEQSSLKDKYQDLESLINIEREKGNQHDMEEAYSCILFNENGDTENIKMLIEKFKEILISTPITKIKSIIFEEIEKNNKLEKEFLIKIKPLLKKLRVSEKESNLLFSHIKNKNLIETTIILGKKTYVISSEKNNILNTDSTNIINVFSKILNEIFEENKYKFESDIIKTEIWFEV